VVEDETPGQGQEKERLGDEQNVAGLCFYENFADGVVNDRH
jgi:hypothetical protein